MSDNEKIVEILPGAKLSAKALLAELYDMAERGQIDTIVIGYTYAGDHPKAGLATVWCSETTNAILAYITGLIRRRMDETIYDHD